MSSKLAKMTSLQRANLLMNSDFKSGIINQKGIASLDLSNGSTELTVDGWISYGINCSVADDFITYANRTSTKHTVKQPIKIRSAAQLTIYVSAFNVSGNVYVYLDSYDGQKKKLINGDNIVIVNLSTSIPGKFIIEFESGAGASLNRIKLEYGNCYTGMPAWNGTIELLKCMQYFQRIYVKAHNNAGTTSNKYYSVDTMFQIPMQKEPSAIIKKAYLMNATDITNAVKDATVDVGTRNIGTIVLTAARSDYIIKFDFWLDAYDY